MPTELGDADLHFWLTRSVGRSIGLNFSDAMDEGRLDPEGYAQLVAKCRSCQMAQDCQRWLGAKGGRGRAVRAPDFCLIGRSLNALKPH